MICPKCGAGKMSRDKPIYFNRDNREGDSLYLEDIYRCPLCGKVLFLHMKTRFPKKRFVKGQVITGGYDNL